MRRLLVLRPEPGASATVERARQKGLDAFAIPLFNVEPVEWEIPGSSRFEALLLTSANAVHFGGEQLHRLRGSPAYAVGPATADAAASAGLEIAAIGNRGLDELLKSIAPELKLLHLCGQDRRSSTNASQEIVPVVVYRSTPIDRPDLSAAAGSVAIIHSPRAGRRFAELVGDRGSITIVAISPAAAEAVGAGWNEVESAPLPNDEALLALAASLCDKPSAK
jgi:uroporphyrinogen-III synthase